MSCVMSYVPGLLLSSEGPCLSWFSLTASAVGLRFHPNSMLKGIRTLPGKYPINRCVFEYSPIPATTSVFSQPPFSLFLQSSGIRSGFPLNIDCVLRCEPFMQLCLCDCSWHFIRSPNSWINFRQCRLCEKSIASPHSHLPQQKLEGGCTLGLMYLSRLHKLSSQVICPRTLALGFFPFSPTIVLIRS